MKIADLFAKMFEIHCLANGGSSRDMKWGVGDFVSACKAIWQIYNPDEVWTAEIGAWVGDSFLIEIDKR